ncbi:MAG: murein biosynthesis integral membrane protein MurJ [Ardenticatenales bacterium]
MPTPPTAAASAHASDATNAPDAAADATDAADATSGRRIARASALVGGLFLAAKLVGLLRERAIGARFGVSADYDAYVAAFRVPDLLFTVFAGGALISAFLPVFSAALEDEDRKGAWALASGVTNLVVTATIVAAIAAALWSEGLSRFVAPSFTPQQLALTAHLMRIILVSTVIFAVSGLQFGILNAFQHFLTPALATVVYNVGIIVGAIWLAPRFGIDGLAYGVVLGAIAHLLIKAPPLLAHGFRWVPRYGLGDPRVRQVLRLLWPRMLALGAVQAVFIANTRLASAAGTSAVSAVNYAWIISQMPQSILGTAVGTAAFPTLASLAARGQRDRLRHTAADALVAMMTLTVPAAVGLAVLAGPAVQVLLQTGRFGPEAAALTAAALRMFALGLVGHVTLEVAARLFYAQQDTRTPLLISIGTMVVNIGLAVAFLTLAEAAAWPLTARVAAIALANSIAVSLEVAAALWLVRARLGGIEGRRLAGTLGRAGLAGGLMAGAMLAVQAALPERIALGALAGPLGDGLVRLALAGSAGALAYGVAALALGLVPAAQLSAWLRRGR